MDFIVKLYIINTLIITDLKDVGEMVFPKKGLYRNKGIKEFF